MKNSTLLISFIFTATLLLSACSNARYGHLTRTVKTEKIVKQDQPRKKQVQHPRTQQVAAENVNLTFKTEIKPKAMTTSVEIANEVTHLEEMQATKFEVHELAAKADVVSTEKQPTKLKEFKSKVDNAVANNKNLRRVVKTIEKKMKAKPDSDRGLLGDILVIVLVLLLVSILLSILPQPLSYVLSVVLTVILILYLLNILL